MSISKFLGSGFLRICAIIAVGSGLSACSSVVNPLEGDTESEMAGAALFVDEGCAVCHGTDLKGTSAGPNILSEASGASDGSLQKVIQNGKGDMPDFAHLSDTEVWQLVSYLRTVP